MEIRLLEGAYPRTGDLGAALKEFKRLAISGAPDNLPRYLREFTEQLFADVIALEVHLKINKVEMPEWWEG